MPGPLRNVHCSPGAPAPFPPSTTNTRQSLESCCAQASFSWGRFRPDHASTACLPVSHPFPSGPSAGLSLLKPRSRNVTSKGCTQPTPWRVSPLVSPLCSRPPGRHPTTSPAASPSSLQGPQPATPAPFLGLGTRCLLSLAWKNVPSLLQCPQSFAETLLEHSLT